MEEKTKEQLEDRIALMECLEKERLVSDNRYALKIYERAFIAMVATILLAFIGAIIKLVFIP